jgi:hypothetical protein
MKILNWSHIHEFSSLLDSLSQAEEEDIVIQIGRHSHIGWYYIALIARLHPRKHIIFICRDQRLRVLLKQYGFISHTSIQSISDILPEGAHIVQENL